MTAPPNTYNSEADLSLGHLPKGADDNLELYEELLDIHNAIESSVTFVGDSINTRKATRTVIGDYTVQATDGTIKVDASAGLPIVITLLPATGSGFRYDVKKVAGSSSAIVTLVGDGTQLVDERPDGIRISLKSSYTVKDVGIGWDIV